MTRLLFSYEGNEANLHLELKYKHVSHPATLEDLVVMAEGELGTGLAEFTQSTNGQVLFVQLLGSNLCLSLQNNHFSFILAFSRPEYRKVKKGLGGTKCSLYF